LVNQSINQFLGWPK